MNTLKTITLVAFVISVGCRESSTLTGPLVAEVYAANPVVEKSESPALVAATPFDCTAFTKAAVRVSITENQASLTAEVSTPLAGTRYLEILWDEFAVLDPNGTHPRRATFLTSSPNYMVLPHTYPIPDAPIEVSVRVRIKIEGLEGECNRVRQVTVTRPALTGGSSGEFPQLPTAPCLSPNVLAWVTAETRYVCATVDETIPLCHAVMGLEGVVEEQQLYFWDSISPIHLVAPHENDYRGFCDGRLIQ